jgi:hypothetical protein
MIKDIRPNNEKLQELLAAREALLIEKPELRELQFTINDILAGAGTQQNRMILLKKLMLESLAELHTHTEQLSTTLHTLQNNFKDLQNKPSKAP